jgi:small subunit ribosomal protein S2
MSPEEIENPDPGVPKPAADAGSEEASQADPAAADAPSATEAAQPDAADAEPENGKLDPEAQPALTLKERSVSIRQLIEAGVHFGHQTNRWNPRMAPYIYGARNGIHIINLDETARALRRAYAFVVRAVARGGTVLFVGTKRQAQEVVREEAVRAGQHFVIGRWLGGTLTNFRTIKSGIDRLRTLQRLEEEGDLETLSKKEALGLRREKERLERYLGGIREMNGPPAVLFLIDPNNEHIAVREANKLEIPIVALADTNCNPDPIDMIVPGNDDAIRSIKLVTTHVAEACLEGQKHRRDFLQSERREEPSSGVSVEFARSRRVASSFVYSATPNGEVVKGEQPSEGEGNGGA